MRVVKITNDLHIIESRTKSINCKTTEHTMIKVTLSKEKNVVYTIKYKNFQDANAAVFALRRLSTREQIKVPVDKACVKEGQFTYKQVQNPYYGLDVNIQPKFNQQSKRS